MKSKLQMAAIVGLFWLSVASVLWLYPVTGGSEKPDLRIRAIAHQWWWEFDYPAQGFRTSNVLYLPSDRKVRVELSSADAIHSFWILGMKESITIPPGKPRAVDLLMKSEGELYGNCDSGCGCGAGCMRFRVLVRTPVDFAKLTVNQRAQPSAFTPPLLAAAPPCATDPTRDHRTARNAPNTHLQHLLDGG